MGGAEDEWEEKKMNGRKRSPYFTYFHELNRSFPCYLAPRHCDNTSPIRCLSSGRCRSLTTSSSAGMASPRHPPRRRQNHSVRQPGCLTRPHKFQIPDAAPGRESR